MAEPIPMSPEHEPSVRGKAVAEPDAMANDLATRVATAGLTGNENSQYDSTTAALPDGVQLAPSMATLAAGMALPGGRRFGNYELIAEIARGGMGVVYKAHQLRPSRLVAIKMILAGSLASRQDVQRFYVEAEAAAHLERHGIVPIFEVGEIDGQHFFSMGFIEGESLATRIKRGPLPPREAASLLHCVTCSVQFAHDRGIVHRDLKPGNILIDKENFPWITDFGLARRISDKSELTTTGQILGTPNYMSPEQATGHPHEAGAAADIYALGAILYAALTGRPPFQAASLAETLHQVIGQEPVPPHLLNPAIPLDLDTICLRCLEKLPARRFARAQDLADELQRYLNGEPILSRRISRRERAWRWCQRQPLVASLLAACILSLLLGITISSRLAYTARRRAQEAIENLELAARNEQTAKQIAAQMAQERNEKTARLRDAYYAEAQALRWSGRAGRRRQALNALTQAAAIQPSLALRNEAVAALALFDMDLDRTWPGRTIGKAALAFSADGQIYARTDTEGNLSVREAAGDQEIAFLQGPGFPAWILQFSPDGKWIVGKFHPQNDERDCLLLVWDIASGKRLYELPGGQLHPPLAFSADGRQFIAYAKREGILVRISTADWSLTAKKVMTAPHAVAWSRSQSRLALSSNTTIELLDANDLKTLSKISCPSTVRGLSWSGDDQWIAAAGADGVVYLEHPDQPDLRRKLVGHAATTTLVNFNPHGDLLASTCWEGRVIIWDVASGKVMASASGSPTNLQFTNDGLGLANFLDGEHCGLWKVTPFSIFCPLPITIEDGSDEPVWGACFLPGGRFVAAACQTAVRIWDVRKRRLIASVPISGNRSVAYDPIGEQLLISGFGGLYRWPIRLPPRDSDAGLSLMPVERFEDLPPRMMERFALSLERRELAVTCRDTGEILVVDLATGTHQSLAGRHAGAVFIDISGQWIATGAWNDTGVGLWSVSERRFVDLLPVQGRAAVRFNRQGNRLVSGIGQEYVLWDVAKRQPIRTWPRHHAADLWGPIAFSSDGSLLAIAPSRETVCLLAADSGLELATLEAPSALPVLWLEFAPDSNDLLVASKHVVAVWHVSALRKELSNMGLDWSAPHQLATAATTQGAASEMSPKALIGHRARFQRPDD